MIFPAAERPGGREQAAKRVRNRIAVAPKQQAGNNDPMEGVRKRAAATGERKAVARCWFQPPRAGCRCER